jgi:hypothetical protein
MKRNVYHRLSVEALENRWCPSVTARVTPDGSLQIRGSSADLQITQTSPGVFKVIDEGLDRGTFARVRNDLWLDLRGDNDRVVIDLGGVYGNNAVLDSIFANLGDGDDVLSIRRGTVTESVAVRGGAGSGDDILFSADLEVRQNVSVLSAHFVTLEEGSFIGGNLFLTGGAAANWYTLSGVINGSAFLSGSYDADQVYITNTAIIDGSLLAHLHNGDDLFRMDGQVAGSLILDTARGNDLVEMRGRIGHSALVFLGADDDRFSFAGEFGYESSWNNMLFVDAGQGNDTATFFQSATLHGTSSVQLGNGDDTFILEDRAASLSLTVNGGRGQDTFDGNPAMLSVPPVSFEVFLNGDDGGEEEEPPPE